MIVFPNCKINLGLNILAKRKDGFHDLETCFVPLNFCDAFEIIASQDATQITVSGIKTGNKKDNLCLKAYYLLKENYPQLPEVNIHLHKVIPIGAGLGGGSADATFTLLLLNKKFNLNISSEKIYEYALQLGSDCPFFLTNKICIGSGRGEILKEINLSLDDYKIAIINPGIHINTAEAFRNIQSKVPKKDIEKIILQPIETWKQELHNDFEDYVFEKYASIKKIKEDLYNAGAVYSSMSGSGSTVFGIFDKSKLPDYKNTEHFYYKIVNVIT